MFVKQSFAFFVIFLLFINNMDVKSEETAGTYCPNQGKAVHGKWRLNEKDGLRCVLDCENGYSANGCPIIRKDEYGEWNHNITTCDEDSWLFNRKTACFTALAAAIAASPWILAALGFSGIGIVAGLFAASWMSYMGVVHAGSIFAWLQSLGMTGIGYGMVLKLMALAGGACDGLVDFFSDIPCEEE